MDKIKQKLSNISDEDFNALMASVEEAAKNFYTEKIAEKELLLIKLKELQDKNEQLRKEAQNEPNWKLKQAIQDVRQELNRKQIPAIESKLKNLENLIKAIQYGGSIQAFDDALGQKISDIPDFREIKSKLISFNQETILVDEIPNYIPLIDEKKFESMGCVFDAIRITVDSYLFAPFGYKYGEENQFVLLTLDQLILTNLYYITRLKAEYQKEADRKTQRNIDYYYTLSIEKRLKNFAQKGYYQSLPAKVKKQINEEDWLALSLEEKEKLEIPIKRYGPERIKSKLDDKHMWVSFHSMYNQFINPTSLPFIKKDGQYIPLELGKQGYGIYSNPEVSEYWKKFRDMMEWKIKDIEFQREELSENYKTAIETSFGESNTKNTLLADFGVLIKRQNGDEINIIETEQIKKGLETFENTFGSLKTDFLKNNIKISHTGNKLVFARKAIGVYISDMGTMAVSNKYGEVIFNTTLAHEIAHFIDNKIGENNGKRWETDNYESAAGKLAFAFRNNMNKPKTEQNDYINATKECFARCLEQYFAVKIYGDDVEIVYSDHPASSPEKIFTQDAYAGKENFYQNIEPLVTKFLEENKSFFGAKTEFIHDDSQEILDTISGLQVLLLTADDSEKEEINDTISGLQILLLN